MKKYQCYKCGWVYDEARGVPTKGIMPGTKWEDLPDEFKCCECDIRKKDVHMWKELEE